MAASQPVTEIVVDASDVERAERLVVGAFDHMGERAAAAEAKMQASIDETLKIYGRNVPQALGRVEEAYARLQGKLDPVVAAQQRMEREMVASLGTINRAVLLGVTTEQEATRTIQRLKQQQIEYINGVRDAQLAANYVVGRSHMNDNDPRYRRQNLSYQLFDIAQSSAGGINPAMVAMQQGPQILQLYAGEGGINAALKDTIGLLSGVARALGPIALVAAAVAGGFSLIADRVSETSGKVVTMGDIFHGTLSMVKRNLEEELAPAISALEPRFADLWKFAGDQAVEQFNKIAQGAAQFEAQIDRAIAYTKAAFTAGKEAAVAIWSELPSAIGDKIYEAAQALIGGIQGMVNKAIKPINDLIAGINAAIANLPGAGKLNTIPKLDIGLGPNPNAGSAANLADELQAIRGRQIVATVRADTDYVRRMKGIQGHDYLGDVTADVLDDKSYGLPDTVSILPSPRPSGEQMAIDMEKGSKATNSAANAYRDLVKNAEDANATLRTQIDTFGQYGAAVETTRKEEQLLAQATDHGRSLTAAQKQRIHELAIEYGALADQLERTKLNADIRFDIEQMNRSPEDQKIAQRLRGTGIGMDSPEADTLRQIDGIEQMRTSATGFFTAIKDGTLSGGKDIGRSIMQHIADAMAKEADQALDRVIDMLVRSIFRMPAGAPGGTTPFGAGGSILDVIGKVAMGGAANDNTPAGQFSAAGLADRNLARGDVAAMGWNFFKGKGYSDVATAAILGQASAESGFNPKAIGDGGLASGLFQWHPDRGGGAALRGAGPMAQFQHLYDELQGPESAANRGLLSATTLREANRAAIGFERPRGWSVGNPEGGDNFSGRFNASAQVLDRFHGSVSASTAAVDTMKTASTAAASASGEVAKGLSAAGGGLGNFGDALSQFPAAPAAPAGGGGGLFGGLFGKIFGSAFTPLGGQATWAFNNPGMGLFADGGYTGHGPADRVAGLAHKGEFYFSAAATRNLGVDYLSTLHDIGKRGVGFRDGGYAGGSVPMPRMQAPANDRGVIVNVINPPGAGMEVASRRETRDAEGNRVLELQMRSVARDEMTTPGRKGERAQRQAFQGVKRRVVEN